MKPVNTADRIVSIDLLRGVALAGVLLINLITGFRAPLSAHIQGQNQPLGPGGSLLLGLVEALIEFKAFALFSFLFGVGVGMQASRADGRHPSYFLLRRFGTLFAIGLAHLLLVWNGDILALYGLCGLLLVPLLRLSAPAIAFLGCVLIAAPYVLQLPAPFPDELTLKNLTVDAFNAYRSSRWHELFAFRWRETQLLILPLLLLSLPRTLGLMLWGVAVWRRGLLDGGSRRFWRSVLFLGSAFGAIGVSLGKESLATIPLAAAYAAALLLWRPYAPSIAAAGQMALTNYLMQSIILGFVFYGYGFGRFGTVGIGAALVGGLVLYCVQLAFSRWWLRRFYFGPFEWLWRSISYLEWQPFRREDGRK